ncbi:MAG: Holliday junction branch migration protein RuvA [Pseudomonadota bacterium]
MIGKISGRVEILGADHVLVDTGGVGYVIYCDDRTLSGLPPRGEWVSFFTELLVREDLLQLFGFRTLAEREWHRLLTSVQGVGARGALAILGTLGAEGVGRALSLGDAGSIRAAPGIGPKLAQRIVLELQSKAPRVLAMGADGAQVATPSKSAASARTPTPESDAVVTEAASAATMQAEALSALVNLGYSQGEAAAAVAQAADQADTNETAAVIRAALRLLSQGA